VFSLVSRIRFCLAVIVCFALSFKTCFVSVDFVPSSILLSYLGYLTVV